MSNAILYSFYAPRHPDQSEVFVMLQHSLETLRKHNQDIPVIVYLSPKEYKQYFVEKLSEYNVKLIIHEKILDDRFDESFARLEHKWFNIFEGLKMYNSILHVDCDTAFYDDPETIFIKYTDPKKIYCRGAYIGGDFYNFFKIDNLVMNDGQILIRDYFLDQAENFINLRKKYMLESVSYLDSLNLSKDERNKIYEWVMWAGTQYGISEHLHEINAFAEFDVEDVAMYPELVSASDAFTLVLLHYFNYNIHHVLPQRYLDLIDKEYKRYAANIQKEWTWDV